MFIEATVTGLTVLPVSVRWCKNSCWESNKRSGGQTLSKASNRGQEKSPRAGQAYSDDSPASPSSLQQSAAQQPPFQKRDLHIQ